MASNVDLFRFLVNQLSFKTKRASTRGRLVLFFLLMRVVEPPKSVVLYASSPGLPNGYHILTYWYLHKFLYAVSYLNSGGGESDARQGRGRKRPVWL